jgi:beta-lactam-binding protein with PASTA domain
LTPVGGDGGVGGRMRRGVSNARPSNTRRSRSQRVQESRTELPRLVGARSDPALGLSRDEKRRERRAFSGILWLGLFSFTALSLILLSFQSWTFFSGAKNDTVVPGIIGIKYEDAALSVEQAGLILRIRGESYTDDIEADRIIEQNPSSGARVKVGRDVQVDVSLGSRTLRTPNVIGRAKEEAIADLEEMGVKYRMTTQYTDAAPDGTIINQSPPGGAPIAVGEAVELVAAVRPLNTMVTMPHLEGLTYDEALQLIAENQLALRQVRRVYQSDVSTVTVYTQFPLAGSQTRAGGEVILTLSCPSSQEAEGQRSSRISVTVPQSVGTVRVRIVVQDRYQTREAYSAEHTGPTTVEQLITTYGRATVKVYFDNRIVREESF